MSLFKFHQRFDLFIHVLVKRPIILPKCRLAPLLQVFVRISRERNFLKVIIVVRIVLRDDAIVLDILHQDLSRIKRSPSRVLTIVLEAPNQFFGLWRNILIVLHQISNLSIFIDLFKFSLFLVEGLTLLFLRRQLYFPIRLLEYAHEVQSPVFSLHV